MPLGPLLGRLHQGVLPVGVVSCEVLEYHLLDADFRTF